MPTEEPSPIYTVEVEGREDGLYLFAYHGDAERFALAVRRAGGVAYRGEEPVIATTEVLEALCAAEVE